ncbi:MAG: glycosyl transferase family 25 [Pseudooceanicola sp.]|nr:glycosyl transferase family 25 [Pseudooceanicola sp.]
MITSYIIHLDGSDARLPLVDALMQRLPNPQVLPAVDGRAMSAEECAECYQPGLLSPRYPFAASPGEIGCFLSHRAAWAKIAASEDVAGLVAEDDVILDPGFDSALALVTSAARPDRLIRLPMSNKEEVAKVVAERDGVQLFRPRVVGLTAALQVIGRDAAARLLALTERFDRPVDTFQQMTWLTGIETLTISPSPAHTEAAKSGGSTIQSHLRLRDELTRSWRRSRYRAAVARLSRGTP